MFLLSMHQTFSYTEVSQPRPVLMAINSGVSWYTWHPVFILRSQQSNQYTRQKKTEAPADTCVSPGAVLVWHGSQLDKCEDSAALVVERCNWPPVYCSVGITRLGSNDWLIDWLINCLLRVQQTIMIQSQTHKQRQDIRYTAECKDIHKFISETCFHARYVNVSTWTAKTPESLGQW